MIKYKIEKKVDLKFKSSYEAYMLSKSGKDKLPNPHNARHGIFHNYRPWEYDKVFNHANFEEDDIVLDTGSMHTYFSIYIANFVKKIYTTDNFYWIKRDYINKERLLSPEEWITYIESKGDGKIIGENCDITDLKYKDNTFHKVLCISTLEHVIDDQKGIKELARVLKPSGRLLLTTEFNFHIGKKYSEKDNSYYRVYNLKSIGELIKNSGLSLCSPMLLENRNYLYIRKNVNAFLCFKKSSDS